MTSSSAPMPKVMIFIRHAIAEPAEKFNGPDEDRPLTRKGLKKAEKVFSKLIRHFRPNRIISSPYLRARETASLLQEALAATTNPAAKPVSIETSDALVPDATWDLWQNALASSALRFESDDIVAIVGHEPSLGQIFCRHIGFSEAIPFKKAGVGIIEPEGMTRARLIAFAPARFLKS